MSFEAIDAILDHIAQEREETTVSAPESLDCAINLLVHPSATPKPVPQEADRPARPFSGLPAL